MAVHSLSRPPTRRIARSRDALDRGVAVHARSAGPAARAIGEALDRFPDLEAKVAGSAANSHGDGYY
jgi:hypothetical protein